jgi:hypothetical protein
MVGQWWLTPYLRRLQTLPRRRIGGYVRFLPVSCSYCDEIRG